MSDSSRVVVLPEDEHNRVLIDHLHPPSHRNPSPRARYDLVVVGAGPGGLVAAAIAASLGAQVALVERRLMGGDCLNVGCVPSKTLIRAARAAHELRLAPEFGVRGYPAATVDFAAVMERVRRVRASMSAHDSVERFQSGYGIDVFLGQGTFTGPHAMAVDGVQLTFKKAIVATGSHPAIPAIPGLEDAEYHTNESIFTITEMPKRLVVIGAGPVGCELAQAFARLGSAVTLLHRGPRILEKEDAEVSALLKRVFAREGIRVVTGCEIAAVEKGDRVRVHFAAAGHTDALEADEILVASGRRPNVDGLGLDAAGVAHDAKGVTVDDRLRTSNAAIFAIGDVALGMKFTHAADASARMAVQNALFWGRKKVSSLTVPWCTYTDPEVAHVGLTEAAAHAKRVDVDTYTRALADVDRGRTDGETEGFVRIHCRRGTDTMVGATIVARHAGEMINEITVAMAHGLGLGKLAVVIHPYPTQSEAIRQCGDLYTRTRLTPVRKRILERIIAWRR